MSSRTTPTPVTSAPGAVHSRSQPQVQQGGSNRIELGGGGAGDFRNFLRALVARGAATWFNDPFSVPTTSGGTTQVALNVSPQQTILLTQMRAYTPYSHAIALTIQAEGYTFWDDPDMDNPLYASPVDFIEEMMNFPSTRQINLTLTNMVEIPVNVNFLFFGLTMDTNVWESVQEAYFSGVIESAIGSE